RHTPGNPGSRRPLRRSGSDSARRRTTRAQSIEAVGLPDEATAQEARVLLVRLASARDRRQLARLASSAGGPGTCGLPRARQARLLGAGSSPARVAPPIAREGPASRLRSPPREEVRSKRADEARGRGQRLDRAR